MAYASISKPSLHFNTKLYTGNGGTQSITGVGFQPDWVWIKRRGATNTHTLWDAVRGTTKWIESNSNNAEQTYAGGLTAFGTDGFSIGVGIQKMDKYPVMEMLIYRLAQHMAREIL